MKILIIGASGYVGSALVEDLRQHHEVIAAARNIHRIPHQGIQKKEMDITSIEQVQRVIEEIQPDVVIHAAALPKRSVSDEKTFIQTNVAGTSNIAKAVANYSNAKLIFLSSGCAFKQLPGVVVSEHSAREMDTAFSKSKNEAEKEILEKFSGQESRVAILYPPIILHRDQQQGIVPYALKDACNTGIVTNKVPGGHVNFITHTKLAEFIDIISHDKASDKVQRYLITGTRFQTGEFFGKLQGVFKERHNITCDIQTESDAHVETMCATDESSLRRLKPGFHWGEIDEVMAEIISSNLKKDTSLKVPAGGRISVSGDRLHR